MRLGVIRALDAKATVLKKQLEAIKFAEGKDTDNFGIRGVLRVTVADPEVILKFLPVVPKKFSQMACSIETLFDLESLFVEELIGRLKAAEEHYELEDRRPSKLGNCSSLKRSGSPG
jgi:hypothetical protein